MIPMRQDVPCELAPDGVVACADDADAEAVVRRLDREDGAAVAVTAGWSRP